MDGITDGELWRCNDCGVLTLSDTKRVQLRCDCPKQAGRHTLVWPQDGITRTAKIQSLGTLDGMGPHVVLEIDLLGILDGMAPGALVTGIPLSEEEVVALANGPGLYGTVRVTIETGDPEQSEFRHERNATGAVENPDGPLVARKGN